MRQMRFPRYNRQRVRCTGELPTHIALEAGKYGLPKNSVVLLEQIRTLDKRRLKEKIGELPLNMMTRVNEALLISLGFFET